MNENNFCPRILYTAKLSFKTDKPIKVFHDKQKLKQYTATKLPLQKILKGILHTQKPKTNITTRGWEVLNLMRRTDKHPESSIKSSKSSVHTQILK
jgi:hypothetical protein